jgi:3-phosphoshikimate 1-carboxyvinyltransferase
VRQSPRFGTVTRVVELQAPARVDWTLRPPGSKSLTNRALLLAAIAHGRSRITGCLDADDSQLMRAALMKLGIAIEADDDDTTLVVEGASGPLPAVQGVPEIFVGTAGTVARFLVAVLAASPVHARVDGTPRMRERPMDQLVDALRKLGADVRDLGAPGCLPIEMIPRGLAGGELRFPRPASSQFISGVLLAAPLAASPTRIVLEQGTPARPYVDMTLATIAAFGGAARWVSDDTLVVTPGSLRACDFAVEPDASAASYPLALAAIHGGRTRIDDLGSASLQGDVAFARVLERMGARVQQTATQTIVEGTGALEGGAFDLSDMPDMTLTLAVAALFARGPTTITGVAVLRHHESDRLAAAATELRKLGADVDEREDGLRIVPPPGGPRRGVEIDTYDDHRMAMAFSLVGHVRIRNPQCVAKTYPDYFNHLGKLGMVNAGA